MKKRTNSLLALFISAAMTATSCAWTVPAFAENLDAVQSTEVSEVLEDTDSQDDGLFIAEETPAESEELYTDEVEGAVEEEVFDDGGTEDFSDREEMVFSSDMEEGMTDELTATDAIEAGKAYSVTTSIVMRDTGKASGMYEMENVVVTAQSDGTYLVRMHQKKKNRNLIAITEDKAEATNHEVPWYVGSGADGCWFTLPVKTLDEPLYFSMCSVDRVNSGEEFGNIIKCTFDASSLKESTENPAVSSDIETSTDFAVSNTASMFKVSNAFFVKSAKGQTLYLTLGSTGYENLYKGTYEDAVANGNNSDNWIKFANTKNGYRFAIPVTEGETKIPFVSISKSKVDGAQKGENALEKAFYPRQCVIDYNAKAITVGEFEDTISLTVANQVKMFSVKEASLNTIAGPNSNNYKETLQLTMGSDSFDKAFVGNAEDAANAEQTMAITNRRVDIVVEANKKGGEVVTDYLDKPVVVSFHSVKNDAWYERVLTTSKSGKSLLITDAIYASGITLNETEKTVHSGESFTLTATVEPSNTTEKLVWSSDKEDVVVVDQTGKITAVKCGTAVITAKVGACTAQCKVTVSHTEEILPAVAATCTKDGWTEGKKCSVCNVILKAQKVVKATGHKEEVIPAVAATPGHTGLTEGKKCSVCGEILEAQKETPALPILVTGVKVSAKTSTKIAAGKKVQLIATVAPTNAENKAVKWKSSNKKVATVDANGVVTMKKNAGGKSVVITATAKDGSKVYGKIKLTCKKGVVTKITISGKKTVKAGKSLTLKAKVEATGKANKKVAWSSSNKKLATVTSKGVVKTFKGKKGTVKITARSLDGSNKKATFKIKIK